MMHPKYERARMLDAAITAAAHAMDDPIDRVEVIGDRVIVQAKGRRIIYLYDYNDSYDEMGAPILGGGHWSVRPADGVPGILARLLGRRRSRE